MKNGFFFLLSLLTCANIAFAQNVTSVNFIQESDVSKLIIDFDKDVYAERKHIPEDKQIILDVKDAKSAKKYLRGIDTSEFSGATVYISGYEKPGSKNDLRFTVQLRDNVRSILERKSNRLVLSIENRFGVFTKKKLKKAEALAQDLDPEAVVDSNIKINIPKSDSVEDILENLTLSGIKKYVGKRISINVNSVPYDEILKMIADTSGFNIIIDNQVSSLPPLTLNLTNIPWDQALDTILELGSLIAEKHANILTVKTKAQAMEERAKEIEAKNSTISQEPLVTKIFPLSFAEQKDMIKIIEDYLTKDRGKIQADTRTNNLIVKDTVEAIERIKKIIDTLDTQTPQILIEAKIVEASEEYEFRAGLGRQGLKFGYNPLGGVEDDAGTFSFSSATDKEFPSVFGANISVFKRLTGLEFSLELMESESKGRVVSAPKVVTQNNVEANISTTETTSFRTVNVAEDGNSTGFDSVSATISLKVTPKVTNDGSIAMAVDLKKEGFGNRPTADAPPNTTSRDIKTNVLVDNGSTIVIGGLYQATTGEVSSGVPFLKDLPLIGWLFKSAYNPNKSRTELMVFLTPRVINQEEAGLVSRNISEESN